MPLDKPERWFLSAEELAELAGVHAKTVKRWFVRGTMAGFKTKKGEWRVLLLSVTRFIKANPEYAYILEKFLEHYRPAPIGRVVEKGGSQA